MTPWILVSLGVMAAVGLGMAIYARKTAQIGPHPQDHDQAIPVMSDRKAVLFGLALILAALLTIGFYDMSFWFLPIVLYLTVWIPQVARKAASPRQAILVASMFTVGMLVSILYQAFVVG